MTESPSIDGLAACPFCGATPEIADYTVSCENPFCEAQPTTGGQSQNEAIDGWNRRPESLAQPALDVDALSGAIMNIPCDKAPADGEHEHWYKIGHRDARHAAAELVNAAPTAQPVEVRMLSDVEITDCECGREVQTGQAVIRRFCEVNALKVKP